MNYLHSMNPWARLASIHGVPGDFTHPRSAWADYMDTQAGNEVGHRTVHEHGLRNRNLVAKPLIQEEFGEGQEDTAHRQKAWAAFTAGAAGSGTGAFLAPLAQLVAQVDFERMAPADALAVSGNAYVLAEAGQTYVIYLYDGGTLRLNLSGVSGTFAGRWFDPAPAPSATPAAWRPGRRSASRRPPPGTGLCCSPAAAEPSRPLRARQ